MYFEMNFVVLSVINGSVPPSLSFSSLSPFSFLFFLPLLSPLSSHPLLSSPSLIPFSHPFSHPLLSPPSLTPFFHPLLSSPSLTPFSHPLLSPPTLSPPFFLPSTFSLPSSHSPLLENKAGLIGILLYLCKFA